MTRFQIGTAVVTNKRLLILASSTVLLPDAPLNRRRVLCGPLRGIGERAGQRRNH
jgi:hypothetical protein